MDRIILAYYAGGYGPTIRIDTQTIQQMQTVIDLFRTFTRLDQTPIEFSLAMFAKRDDIEGLILRVIPAKPNKTLRLVRRLEAGPLFEWSMSPESWENSCALLDSMSDEEGPCHQYLTDLSIDEALIEVAFMEYRPNL